MLTGGVRDQLDPKPHEILVIKKLKEIHTKKPNSSTKGKIRDISKFIAATRSVSTKVLP